MSSQPKSWFHCGRCGALFESEPGDRPERRCEQCGFDPSLAARVEPVPPPQSAGTITAPAAPAAPEQRRQSSRKVRKRKNKHLMLKLAAAWVLLLALIVTGARFLWGGPRTGRGSTVSATADSPSLSSADQALLAKAAPECGKTYAAFLTAGGPESQTQFVYQPVETIARLSRFYALNPLPKIEPDSLETKDSTLFRIDGEPVVEMALESAAGERYDVSFRQVDEVWRIDWEAYARYSEYPLALFLAGDGPEEAEFRLLARERLAGEREDEESISLIFYAPRFGAPHETGTTSPEFLVRRDSDDGRLLEAGFAAEAEGRRPFGSTLAARDPDDMIRVRVRLRRIEHEEERRFEVVKVEACHWYDTDAAGLQPAE